MKRKSRDAVVELLDHEAIGSRVSGQFGEGTVTAVRVCMEWESIRYGILYDSLTDDTGCHEGLAISELMWEDEDDVEVLEWAGE